MFAISLLVLFLSVCNGDTNDKKIINFNNLRGCNFDKFENKSCLNKYFLADMINNNPRPCDYLRMKFFFADKRPIICVQNKNENEQITFGIIIFKIKFLNYKFF